MAANGSRITLDVNDGTRMGAYVSRPAGAGPHRGVLVIQDALGVNAHFREMCDRYAALGFVAIAPDMFHRTSPGFEADTLVMEQVMPLIKSLTTDGLLADVTAAHRWITTEGGVASERVGAVGFCLGGRAVFLANSALPLGAAISYYGGSIAPGLLDRAASLHAPHLFFWGGLDKGIPPEQRRAVIDAVDAAGKRYVDVTFSDANHGFVQRDRYNAAAAHQSWAMGLAFLEETLGT
jgi:carboxymethylenebutenolidase